MHAWCARLRRDFRDNFSTDFVDGVAWRKCYVTRAVCPVDVVCFYPRIRADRQSDIVTLVCDLVFRIFLEIHVAHSRTIYRDAFAVIARRVLIPNIYV